MSNELSHHGIKGQKWGVRRFQNKDGSLTPAGEKRYYVESDKKERVNDKASSTIPKGFKFNRVGQATLDVNQAGALYVSSGKADAARYVRALGPTLMGKLLKTAGTTVQHIEVKEDLKKSSVRETSKLTAELLKSNPKLAEEVNKSIYAMPVGKEIDQKLISQAVKKPDSKDAKLIAYAVSAMLGDPNFKSEAVQVYEYFRKNGYDAIPDLNDTLTGTSETATIVINPNKLKVTSTTTITKDVMKEGKKYVKSLEKLKVSDIFDEDDEDE